MYNPGATTWIQANDVCRNQGGYLATISTTSENTAVRNLVSSSFGYWIGLDDRYIEGTYVWTDGSTFSYSNWGLGYPTGSTTNDCIEVANSTGQWADVPCSNTLTYFVCQNAVVYGTFFSIEITKYFVII